MTMLICPVVQILFVRYLLAVGRYAWSLLMQEVFMVERHEGKTSVYIESEELNVKTRKYHVSGREWGLYLSQLDKS